METDFQHLNAWLASVAAGRRPWRQEPVLPAWMGPAQRCQRCRGRLYWDVDPLGAAPAEPACMACGWRPARPASARDKADAARPTPARARSPRR